MAKTNGNKDQNSKNKHFEKTIEKKDIKVNCFKVCNPFKFRLVER